MSIITDAMKRKEQKSKMY